MQKYILWLPSWYPNRKDAFDGDFIERQAAAVSEHIKLVVLFVTKDEQLMNNEVVVEKKINNNVIVYTVYYGKTKWGSFFERFHSIIKYFSLQKKIFKDILNENGFPSIVHVHVAMKAGLLALWLHKKYRLPFIVTEHWSGYSPNSIQSIYKANWVQRLLNKKVLKESSLVLPVSNSLGKIINKYFLAINYQVVPNVVNTQLFYFTPVQTKKFRFIHPSSMNYYKNPEGILQACQMVKEKGFDFELVMVGDRPEKLTSLTIQLGLSKQVSFIAAVPYSEVANLFQQSSALLMFSRYENLPCVILEALCCGLPVVSSNVGGIPELIDKENGVLVESENIPALAEAMIQMINHYKDYNRLLISEKASLLFNYAIIGKQHVDIYNNIINKRSLVR